MHSPRARVGGSLQARAPIGDFYKRTQMNENDSERARSFARANSLRHSPSRLVHEIIAQCGYSESRTYLISITPEPLWYLTSLFQPVAFLRSQQNALTAKRGPSIHYDDGKNSKLK